LEAILTLDPNGGDDLLKHIITLYLGNASALLRSLEQTWMQADLDGILSVSHSLKSSSNQVGAEYLAELCGNAETEARNRRYDTSGLALRQIKEEFTRTKAGLDAYLS
jgi:HPt (histidine-containing phosphotransfer) domain-containing protein